MPPRFIPGPVDIDAYRRRIGYEGPLEPTLDVLKALCQRQTFSIPFENLNISAGVPLLVDPRHNFEKLIRQQRGGWCLEQNGVFASVLRAAGFELDILGARVWRGGNLSYPNSHMTLLVHLDEPWIADVGFGGRILGPLRLADRGEQVYGIRTYHVDNDGDQWFIAAGEPGSSTDMYTFRLQPREFADFEDANEWLQTSPESRFTLGDVVSLATPSGRATLGGSRLIITEGEDRQEREVSPAERRATLEERFNIHLA